VIGDKPRQKLRGRAALWPTKPSPQAEHDERIRIELVSVAGLSVHAAAEALNKRGATTPSGVGEIMPEASLARGACRHHHARLPAEIATRVARTEAAARNSTTIDRPGRLKLTINRMAEAAPVSLTSLKNRPDRLEAVRAAGSIVIVSQDVGQSRKAAVRRAAPPPSSQIVVVKNARHLLVGPTTSANGHGGQHDRQN
jgi:hypothetical protein